MKDKDNKRPRGSSDEVDLYFLYLKLSELFQASGRGISNFFRTLLFYKWLLVAFVVLGIGLAYITYSTKKPYYTSSMTLMLANIRNEFIEDQLNKLTIMIAEDNFEAVAERLDISSAQAKEIKDMAFSNLDADRVDEDSVLTGSPFRIELSLYDRTLFDTMEPALTSFLESNRYFARQKRIKQRQIERIIRKLDGEISSIDSLKTDVNSPRGPVNGFVYGQPIDPTNLYRESISLFKEQVKLESDLEKLDNVEVVTGFAPKLRPTGPSLFKHLVIGAFLAFVLGVLMALILQSNRMNKLK
nr:chain length determinant protein [Pontibacter sp. HSC-14F20]